MSPWPSPVPSSSLTPADPETRRFCDQHLIVDFNVVNLGEDLCNLPRAKISPAAWNALVRATELNAEVASALGFSLKELLPDGLQLRLYPNDDGLLGSYASGTTLTMGVFSDWPASAADLDHTINDGVYIHELGHTISLGRSKLPAAAHEMARAGDLLFVETFADTLAMSLRNGQIVTPSPEIPKCLAEFRRISESQSYRVQSGYFDQNFEMNRIRQCCLKHPGTGWELPRIARLCERAGVSSSTPPLKPTYNRAPINFELSESYAFTAFDSHQIGIPLNSFLLELSRRISKPMLELYFGALKELDSDQERRTYLCLPVSAKNLIAPWTTRKFTPEQVLTKIRLKLTLGEQAIFDELVERHGLAKFVSEAQNYPARRAMWVLRRHPWDPTVPVDLQQFVDNCPYMSFNAQGCQLRPECAIECVGSN
jgi:hypothetical protein